MALWNKSKPSPVIDELGQRITKALMADAEAARAERPRDVPRALIFLDPETRLVHIGTAGPFDTSVKIIRVPYASLAFVISSSQAAAAQSELQALKTGGPVIASSNLVQ